MNGPAVSVVIVNWNRRELLRACLLAMRAQTLRQFELIVVDNGSEDGSAAMVEAEFPEAALIRNATNAGYCAANNQGIRQARGRYLALLNNDAEPEPGWLEALVRAAQTAPGIGMCASKILFYEQRDVIDKAGHLIYPDGQNRGRGCGQLDRGQFDRQEEALFPDGCAALYDHRAIEEAGMFDEQFFAYGDDADLGLRIRLAGWGCLYVPDAVVYHHHSSTLGRFSEDRLVLVERNRVWLAVKLFPLRLLVWNKVYTAVRFVANAVAAMRGEGEAGSFVRSSGVLPLARALVRAYAQALAGLPAIWRKRRVVRKSKRLSDRDFLALLRRFRIPARELAFQSRPSEQKPGAA